MTPHRFWAADPADDLIDTVLAQWFEQQDRPQGVEQLSLESVGQCRCLGWRLRFVHPHGVFRAQQNAHYTLRGPAIGQLRIICSGFQPCPPEP